MTTATSTDSPQPDVPVRDIVVIGTPRSGTNFFAECLDALDGVSAYFEIFNPRGVMGVGDADTLGCLSTALGHPVTSARDAELVQFFRQKPLAAVEVLRSCVEARSDSGLAYKVFPRQVSDETLNELIGAEGCVACFVVRRRLDAFVSYQIARQHDVWKNRDTSQMLVEVDVANFLEWAAITDSWYEHALGLARANGTPVLIYEYDSDIDRPKPELVARLAYDLGRHGLQVTPGKGLERLGFRKQDHRVGPFKKILNEDVLRAELRARRAYNYSLAHPLSDTPKPKAPAG